MQDEKEKTIEYFQLRLVEKNIEVECLHRTVFNLCRDYLTAFETPDFVISTTEEDIVREGECAALRAAQEGRPAGAISPGQLESLAVYRKIADKMLDYDTLLIHGAAVAVENRCYLFMAKSGVGKTTHIKNWLRKVPGAYVVNGDKPLVDTGRRLVYGTPWCGKENLGKNICVPLAGLIALERGQENRIDRISFGKLLPCLLQQSYFPEDGNGTVRVVRLMEKLKTVPCYRLSCSPEPESAEVCYAGLRRDNG